MSFTVRDGYRKAKEHEAESLRSEIYGEKVKLMGRTSPDFEKKCYAAIEEAMKSRCSSCWVFSQLGYRTEKFPEPRPGEGLGLLATLGVWLSLESEATIWFHRIEAFVRNENNLDDDAKRVVTALRNNGFKVRINYKIGSEYSSTPRMGISW